MKLMDDPTLCPEGYSIDLYCKYEASHHQYQEFPCGVFAHSGKACRAQVKAMGWTLHRDGTATCPKCNAILRGEKK